VARDHDIRPIESGFSFFEFYRDDYRGASALVLHERPQRLSEARKRRIPNFLVTNLKRIIGQAAAWDSTKSPVSPFGIFSKTAHSIDIS
jgi:hypothetical protein